MKYLKKFENVEEPEIGDYVLMSIQHKKDYYSAYIEFIENNIGEIVSKVGNIIEVRYYVDTYEEFIMLRTHFRYISYDFENNEYYFSNIFYENNILEIGKTKEEVELKKEIKKYNL